MRRKILTEVIITGVPNDMDYITHIFVGVGVGVGGGVCPSGCGMLILGCKICPASVS